MKHHRRSARVSYVFSRDLTVLPAHPHIHPQSEWAIPAFAFPNHLPTQEGRKAELAFYAYSQTAGRPLGTGQNSCYPPWQIKIFVWLPAVLFHEPPSSCNVHPVCIILIFNMSELLPWVVALLGVLCCLILQKPLPPVLTDGGTSMTVVARYPWTGLVPFGGYDEWPSELYIGSVAWSVTRSPVSGGRVEIRTRTHCVTSIIHFCLHSMYTKRLASFTLLTTRLAPPASRTASVDTPIPASYANDPRSIQLPITIPWHHGSNPMCHLSTKFCENRFE